MIRNTGMIAAFALAAVGCATGTEPLLEDGVLYDPSMGRNQSAAEAASLWRSPPGADQPAETVEIPAPPRTTTAQPQSFPTSAPLPDMLSEPAPRRRLFGLRRAPEAPANAHTSSMPEYGPVSGDPYFENRATPRLPATVSAQPPQAAPTPMPVAEPDPAIGVITPPRIVGEAAPSARQVTAAPRRPLAPVQAPVQTVQRPAPMMAETELTPPAPVPVPRPAPTSSRVVSTAALPPVEATAGPQSLSRPFEAVPKPRSNDRNNRRFPEAPTYAEPMGQPDQPVASPPAAMPVTPEPRPMMAGAPAPAPVATATFTPAQLAAAQQFIAEVNALRAAKDLRPVTLSEELSQIAQAHVRDLAARSEVTSATRSGQGIGVRLLESGYMPQVAGSLVSGGYPNYQTALQSWLNNPTQSSRLLHPDTEEMGVGIITDPLSTYRTYIEAIMAAR